MSSGSAVTRMVRALVSKPRPRASRTDIAMPANAKIPVTATCAHGSSGRCWANPMVGTMTRVAGMRRAAVTAGHSRPHWAGHEATASTTMKAESSQEARPATAGSRAAAPSRMRMARTWLSHRRATSRPVPATAMARTSPRSGGTQP